jgi:superfamily II DNA or RNA helicase
MPRAELDAWLADAGLTDFGSLLCTLLAKDLASADRRWLEASWGRQRSLADAICAHSGSSSTRSLVEAPFGVQQAAISLLVGRKQMHERTEASEGTWLASLSVPVPEPEFAALQARLLAVRTQIRATVRPRPRSPSPVSVEVEPDSRSLAVREPILAACSHRHAPTLRVALAASSVAPVTCDCPNGRQGKCGLGLSAVDAALALIAGVDPRPHRQEMLDALRRPTWTRTFETLDRALAETAAKTARAVSQAEDTTIGWRVERWDRAVMVLPVKVGRYKNGRVRLNKLSLHELAAGLHPAATPRDRRAAELIAPAIDRFYIPATYSAARRALLELVGHPHVFLDEAPIALRRAAPVLTLRAGPQGGVVLALTLGDSGDLSARLADETEDVAVTFDATNTACTVAPLRPGLSAIARVVASLRGVEQPAETLPLWLARLPALQTLLDVDLDASLAGRALPAQVDPVIRLRVVGRLNLSVRLVVRPMPAGDVFAPGTGNAVLYGDLDGEAVHTKRDLEAELVAATTLAESLALPPEALTDWAPLETPEDGLDLLARIEAHAPRPTVEWTEGKPLRVTRPARLQDLDLHIGKKRDWFGLEGELNLEGAQVALSGLLAAIRDGRRYIEAKDGALVQLDTQLREGLSTLAATLGDKKSISPAQLRLVDALEALGARVEAPPAWIEIARRARTAEELVAEVPPGLLGTLRPYQLEGFRWMARLSQWAPGCCLADDMGLGKTIQSLALLLGRAASGPALIVAPTSLGFNWAREAERFAPSLRVAQHRDADRRARLATLGKGDVLIASYDLVVRDAEALAEVKFGTVIFDEAHALKNAESLRSKAAALLSAGFRVALTGTPVENRVAEIWAVMRAAVPGLLGAPEDFRERFVVPIERDGDAGRRRTLATVLAPFLLRRTKAEVLPDLPARTDITLRVQLSRAERRLYEEHRLATVAALTADTGLREAQRRVQILSALTRLRQLACHPRLVDPNSTLESSKLAQAVELIAEVRSEGHRPLVFSQFTRFLQLVKAELMQLGLFVSYLDGSTPAAERGRIVDAFQAGEDDAFLLSLKAGGAGLNLTAATYVIHLDPWWNPAVEDQATGRAHRIGQTEPVTVYRLAAEGTVEEAILSMHDDKRALVAALLDGAGAAGKLTTDELIALMAKGAEETEATGIEPD